MKISLRTRTACMGLTQGCGAWAESAQRSGDFVVSALVLITVAAASRRRIVGRVRR